MPLFVRAGASNSWNGKSMPYNLTNDYKSTNSPTGDFDLTIDDSDYKKNLDLAKQRANKFYSEILKKLKDKKIDIKDAKPLIKAFVVDTGGVNDDASTLKNPGQHIFVNIRFEKNDFDFRKIPVSANNILTGAYFCNGLNSKGQTRTVIDGCGSWRDQRMSAWEMKYKPGVIGNTDVVPVARWFINWDNQGKISSFSRVNYDPTGPEPTKELKRVNESISNTTLKYYMTLSGPERWDKLVQPFFQSPWAEPDDATKKLYGNIFDK